MFLSHFQSRVFYDLTFFRLGNQFLCTECEVTSDSLEQIANHVEKDHMREHMKNPAHLDILASSRFKCEKCVVAFSAKGPWLKHMQGMHGTHFPFKCNYCDFKCNRKDQVSSHVLKAHKLTPTPGAHAPVSRSNVRRT